MVGLVVGITRFAWEYAYSVPPCGEEGDNRPPIIKDVHYLHFGIILFAICIIVTVVVSLFTAPIEEKHVSYLALKAPNKNAADDILIFYFYLSKKIRLDVSCESSA